MSKNDRSAYLLELVLFDIAYIISNCDYAYSSDERKYLKIILQKYDEALISYQKAIKIKPDYFHAYYSSGNIHHKIGNFEDAKKRKLVVCNTW